MRGVTAAASSRAISDSSGSASSYRPHRPSRFRTASIPRPDSVTALVGETTESIGAARMGVSNR